MKGYDGVMNALKNAPRPVTITFGIPSDEPPPPEPVAEVHAHGEGSDDDEQGTTIMVRNKEWEVMRIDGERVFLKLVGGTMKKQFSMAQTIDALKAAGMVPSEGTPPAKSATGDFEVEAGPKKGPRYTCVGKQEIRKEPGVDADLIGVAADPRSWVAEGEVVAALSKQKVKGTVWVEFERKDPHVQRGWVSVRDKKGRELLKPA